MCHRPGWRDGAETATNAKTPDAVELTIGQDRYRIPNSLIEPANDQ